jgi:hypothetical protein
MNERIRELANQFFSIMPEDEELEQYSEYLIKYCAQICKTVGGDQVDNASREYQEGREMGAEVCYNQIKKHFGVEQ